MMANLQHAVYETIFGMKRALMRKDQESSDSDDSETRLGGRMHRLKRKAKPAHDQALVTAEEPPAYKRKIEHAGYQRYIIHRNPPKLDIDGDIVEQDDEDEQEDDEEGYTTPLEEDPYADIHLEQILAPLTSAAELPTHPSLSVPYRSKHLTRLTDEACAISRKEQIFLWKAKNLLTRFRGDDTWVPCGAMETELDKYILNVAERTNPSVAVPSITSDNGSVNGSINGRESRFLDQLPPDEGQRRSPVMASTASLGAPEEVHENGVLAQIDAASGKSVEEHRNDVEDIIMANGTDSVGMQGRAEPANGPAHQKPSHAGASQDGGVLREAPENRHGDEASATRHETEQETEEGSDTASQPGSHRMTTRARANARSPSPPGSPTDSLPPIHPFFSFPLSVIPDRDFGLPPAEAEDTRLALQALVQKQEEIARASVDLYLGMLRADRMRQTVFSWAKADGHVGELSDGEDWYDLEEWGLTEDLVKGKEEEDEDTAQPVKKTRQRRTGRNEDR